MKMNVLQEALVPIPVITPWDLTTAPVQRASQSQRMAEPVKVREVLQWTG